MSTAGWPLNALELPMRGTTPRVAVLGLARSGRAAARLLASRGVELELLDRTEPKDEGGELAALVRGGAALRVGPHDPAWLGHYDLLVKSPGIPPTVPFVATAIERGVPVVGELEIAWLATKGPTFAITGTNGKSTTTAWAGDMMRRAGGPVQVVGNIGRPYSEGVLEDPAATFVIEASSFQIQDSRSFAPRAAALLNFTPDHLDYHRDLAEYREAKLSLFDRLDPSSTAVVGPDDALADAVRRRSSARILRFRLEDRGDEGGFVRDGALHLRLHGREVKLIDAAEVSLPGPHNQENALAAALGCVALGAPIDAIRTSLGSFSGLPHRLEPVAVVGGRRFINDSKATNTDSLAVALRAFPQPVVLIAGGRDKGQDFLPLAPLVEERVAVLVLIGEGADRIEQAWRRGVKTIRAASLSEAVDRAFAAAASGQVVLLSPACASFDMFQNYEDRGERFREEVLRLRRAHPEEKAHA